LAVCSTLALVQVGQPVFLLEAQELRDKIKAALKSANSVLLVCIMLFTFELQCKSMSNIAFVYRRFTFINNLTMIFSGKPSNTVILICE